MSAFIQYVNFAGVLLMAGLCLVQWRSNREVNLEANALEQARLEQVAAIQEYQQQVKGCQSDLEALRAHLARTATGWNEAKSNLTAVKLELHQLENERDQLKVSVTNWAAAVAARDSRIMEAGEQLKAIAAERNETVVKFNQLAGKYNEVVRDLNERTQQLNDLSRRLNQELKKE